MIKFQNNIYVNCYPTIQSTFTTYIHFVFKTADNLYAVLFQSTKIHLILKLRFHIFIFHDNHRYSGQNKISHLNKTYFSSDVRQQSRGPFKISLLTVISIKYSTTAKKSDTRQTGNYNNKI